MDTVFDICVKHAEPRARIDDDDDDFQAFDRLLVSSLCQVKKCKSRREKEYLRDALVYLCHVMVDTGNTGFKVH